MIFGADFTGPLFFFIHILRCCDNDDRKSVKVAAENTRTAVLGIQDEMASLQQTFKLAKLGYEARLAEEVAARRRAENEKEAMQQRLEAALTALSSLGIDEPKSS
jgi:hypothetical protein